MNNLLKVLLALLVIFCLITCFDSEAFGGIVKSSLTSYTKDALLVTCTYSGVDHSEYIARHKIRFLTQQYFWTELNNMFPISYLTDKGYVTFNCKKKK